MPQPASEHSRHNTETEALDAILGELDRITAAATRVENDFAGELAAVDPQFRDSAANLLHYIALRRFDLRPLQAKLASYGLSSLGRAERHVMASLQAVRQVLLTIVSGQRRDLSSMAEDVEASTRRLEQHASDMLGPGRVGRMARIMVTLPTEAAADPASVQRLVESGMDVARINCAHDSEPVWQAMIANVRRACEIGNTHCRILMDLAGPKLRTGALLPGPQVLHIKPRRDARGRVIAPKRLWLVADEPPGTRTGSVIPVTGLGALTARRGDCFRFRDTRGKKRQLKVVGAHEHGLRVTCDKSTFVETGTKLKLHRRNTSEVLQVRVGELPPVEQPLLLRKGDELILHRGAAPGKPASINRKGKVEAPAHISCTLPEVFRNVRAGEPVFFNDGKIGGVVRSVSENRMAIRIDKARPFGSRLRGDKSINFPASDLAIVSLTDKDRQDLKFAVAHADAVGLSFARGPADVHELQAELAKLGSRKTGIVVKIETRQGFDNLVRLLLAAMRSYPVGIMIARGDLAVECGWERLAELQEEILWLCEAAQVPVIWATQVLESKTRKGVPSRAEISDASLSQRADCVMLNKGRHIIEAIQMLDNILRRMQAHQNKKSATLRRLCVSDASG